MTYQDAKKRVRIVSGVILGSGLIVAICVYLTAQEPAQSPLLDQLENSKAYRRSLELYGGKANVLAEGFSRWFAGLWHGKSLGITIAVITVIIAFLYRFIASPLPPENK